VTTSLDYAFLLELPREADVTLDQSRHRIFVVHMESHGM
jgi:hypothetical protein